MMLELLLDVAMKGTVLLAAAALVSMLLRRKSAALRHLVWSVTATALLVLPLLTFAVPALAVLPTLDRELSKAVMANEAPAGEASTIDAAAVMQTSETPAPGLSAPAEAATVATFELTPARIVVMVWALGALLVLFVIAVGFTRVRSLARNTILIENQTLLRAVNAVANEMGVKRVVALQGNDNAMPMTWGIWRPTLLLPASAVTWSSGRLHAVLRHELAHTRRRDPLWQMIGEVACALHWFNPLAWHAARRMRVEREHACDDEVLIAGSRASEYASELLEIARSLRSARATSLAAIAMAQPHQLEGRLLAVLDEKRERRRVSRGWRVWIAAIAIVVPLSALQPADSTAQVPAAAAPKVDAPAAESPAIVPPAIVTPAIETPAIQSPCLTKKSRNVSVHTEANDDRHSIKWETGDCKGSLKMEGKVRFTGDLTAIASISPGGEFRLSENRNGDKRELVVTPAGSSLNYEYSVDGDRKPWNAEGRAWLASALSYVVRSTGFAADERIDYLLQQGGVDAVLAEVDAMSSDYVQRMYLQKLIARTTINAAALQKILVTARGQLDSDYELTEFLIAVANRYDFTPAVRAAFLDATTTLNSDYEHRRALSAALKKGGLSSEDVAAMLQASKNLESNHERAELLLSIARNYKLDARMSTAYLEAAGSMRSDYEKGRTFKAVLASTELTGNGLDMILDGASTIASDYERAELLVAVLRKYTLTPQQRQKAIKAIDRFRSDYERGRVATLLIKQTN